MYSLFRVQSLLNVWKVQYCEADYATCARFAKSCSGESVAPNLLPNGKELQLRK